MNVMDLLLLKIIGEIQGKNDLNMLNLDLLVF